MAKKVKQLGKKPTSKMPAGARMSPSGDLGMHRQAEAAKAGGGKLFKGSHAVSASRYLPC